jgi:hypothetical protein
MIHYKEENASVYMAQLRRRDDAKAIQKFKRLCVLLLCAIALGVITFITY